MEDKELLNEEQGSVVGSQEGETGNPAGDGENEQRAADAARQEETEREVNSRMAAARRTGERQARQAVDAEFAALGVTDPDGRPIGSKEDALAYLRSIQEQQLSVEAKKRNVPVEQLRQETAERARGRQELDKESRAQADRAFMERDLQEFAADYPAVDIQKLLANRSFTRFCGSRLGKESISGLYADYVDIYGEAARAGEGKKTEKAERQTGSGSGTAGDTLTRREQAALDDWNTRYPGMKMTAKEWKSR